MCDVFSIQSIVVMLQSLAKPARRYIDEGPLTLLDPQTNKRKHLHFFLFNDLLLGTKKNKQKIIGVQISDVVASKITGTVEKMYKFIIEVPITHESKVVDAGQKIHGKPTFQLISGDMTVSLATENDEEKQEWIQLIQTVIEEQIKKNQSMKVEAPLEKLMKKRESKKMKKYTLANKKASNDTETTNTPPTVPPTAPPFSSPFNTTTINKNDTKDNNVNSNQTEENQITDHKKQTEKKEKQSTQSRRNTLDSTTLNKEK